MPSKNWWKEDGKGGRGGGARRAARGGRAAPQPRKARCVTNLVEADGDQEAGEVLLGGRGDGQPDEDGVDRKAQLDENEVHELVRAHDARLVRLARRRRHVVVVVIGRARRLDRLLRIGRRLGGVVACGGDLAQQTGVGREITVAGGVVVVVVAVARAVAQHMLDEVHREAREAAGGGARAGEREGGAKAADQ